MPSRRLARAIVQIAWLDYDLARTPMRRWLTDICGEHQDDRVRIRAAQALAFIAGHDYRHIKRHVLDPWSESARPVEHQAAAWLLEAASVGDSAGSATADRVQDLLQRWSRSTEWKKQAIAVRAYGTQIGLKAPEVALAGIRISAADPFFPTLPELALTELYAEGLREPVLQELMLWTQAFPAMRQSRRRAGPHLAAAPR